MIPGSSNDKCWCSCTHSCSIWADWQPLEYVSKMLCCLRSSDVSREKTMYNFFSSDYAQGGKWRQDPFFTPRDREPQKDLSLALPLSSPLQKCWLIKTNSYNFKSLWCLENMLGKVSKLPSILEEKSSIFLFFFLKDVLFANLKSSSVTTNFKKSHTETEVGKYFKIPFIYQCSSFSN